MAALLEKQIAVARRFNRFYTRQLGLLAEGYHDSPYSLTEGRVLYELSRRAAPPAGELAEALDLDPGYLSRILRKFEKRGLIRRTPSRADARQYHLGLTAKGRAAFAPLDKASDAQVGAMLAPLSAAKRAALVSAMETVHALLQPPAAPRPFTLRAPRSGELGWIIHRHGVIYSGEYGWDMRHEALVAEIIGQFFLTHDPARERGWVAELDGAVAGSVFLVRHTDAVAKLRVLYVEAAARGRGIGTALVAECLNFARAAGYRKVTLWTISVLAAARRIYQAAGFKLVQSETIHDFGHDLVSETWDLDL